MIVTDDQVSAALEYLAIEPHPLAAAKYDLTAAENERAVTGANLFMGVQGSVEARKAQVELDPDYRKAKAEENTAAMEVENQKVKYDRAKLVIELWRTESANVRAAERIR